jgi:hypothetical protein
MSRIAKILASRMKKGTSRLAQNHTKPRKLPGATGKEINGIL